MTTQTNQGAEGYMNEDRRAFPTVPHTHEVDGVTTDVNTQQTVEMRATDPAFRKTYGYPEGAMAVHRSLNNGEDV